MEKADKEQLMRVLEHCGSYRDCKDCEYDWLEDHGLLCTHEMAKNAYALLKEPEKKQIPLHKKHVITWRRSDEFSMRNLYEAICETLLDEGELFIARTDNHEKVDFVFYVAEGSAKNDS